LAKETKLTRRLISGQIFLERIFSLKKTWSYLMEQDASDIEIDFRGCHRRGIAIFDSTGVNLLEKLLFFKNKSICWKFDKRLKQQTIFKIVSFLYQTMLEACQKQSL
jgi:hypothetical protein